MDLNLSEFQKGQLWPILPAAFEDMWRRLSQYQENGKAYDFEAAIRSNQRKEKDFYQLIDGVAAISIQGPIMKRSSFFSFLFGATSYAFIRRAVREALEDSEVDAIVLKIDSPGGVVNGVEDTGDVIFEARSQKPIIAYADGMMASAAYWLGSAADKVVAGKTSQIGSIGVLMVHEDWSRWNEDKGIKVTYLTAGKYKALGNPDEPLSDLAKETFQAELNYLYTLFVETVARNRDVEPDKVLSDMADGRMFIGQQAQDAGLIDQIENFNSAVQLARSMADDGDNSKRRNFTMSDNAKKELTIDQLKADYPNLVKQIADSAKAEINVKDIAAEATNQERERLLGLVNVQFGDEDGEKFKAIVETGVNVEQFKAIQGTAKGDTDDKTDTDTDTKEIDDAKANMLKVIEGAGAKNPGADAGGGEGDLDYMQLVADYQKEHKCNKFEAQMAVNKMYPGLREKYLKKANG